MAEPILSPELDAASLKGGAFLFVPAASRPFQTPEQFTGDQRQFYRTGAEFAFKEVGSRVAQIEAHDNELLKALLAKAGEIGLLGVDIGEEYGGLGLDKVTSML